MKTGDIYQNGIANLWRTKLRTSLTILGVTIGIGALFSMLAFGTGMQENVTRAFKENDLFTSLYVTPQSIEIEQILSGNVAGAVRSLGEDAPVLGDSILSEILTLPGVDIAFPEIRFPVKLRWGEREARVLLRAMPALMGDYRPFSEIPHGRFFKTDDENGVVLSQAALRDMKIALRERGNRRALSIEDSLRGFRSYRPDDILGQEIEIVTSVIDVAAVMQNPFKHIRQPDAMPIRETSTNFRIVGIQDKPTGFENGRFDAGIIVPIEASERIPRMGFSSIWSLLSAGRNTEGYGSVYVRVHRIEDLAEVKAQIQAMGFGVFSIADQLEEIKRGFLIMDSLLGAVGAIALIVAGLGIINTMIMSILERRREIGVMKAVGGSENEIKGIFFVEAGFIGFIGGLFGLLLGWIVTLIANAVANHFMAQQGAPHIDFFYFPLWLIIGALAFSIVVSLLAGLYPAVRAARVDPVEALRHD